MWITIEPEDTYEKEVNFDCSNCGEYSEGTAVYYRSDTAVDVDCQHCGEPNWVSVEGNAPCYCGDRCRC